MVHLEKLLQNSIKKQADFKQQWLRGRGGVRVNRRGRRGRECVCHCRGADVPLCAVWGAQWNWWYLYVSWVNDRSWVATITVTALWIYHCNRIYDWKIKYVEQSVPKQGSLLCHQYLPIKSMHMCLFRISSKYWSITIRFTVSVSITINRFNLHIVTACVHCVVVSGSRCWIDRSSPWWVCWCTASCLGTPDWGTQKHT